MKKILVIGSPGAGKSTFSRKLGTILELPIVHLDQLNWKNEKETISREEFLLLLTTELDKEKWIIDGNYANTLSLRAEVADAIIWLDFNRFVCIYRVIKRFLMIRFSKQTMSTHGNPNLFEFDFLSFIWNYNRNNRSLNLQLKEKYEKEKQFFQLKGKKKAAAFLIAIKATKKLR